MSKNDSSIVSCRLDAELKSSWFAVCAQLGLSPSCCIVMLAKQMVWRRCLPFIALLPEKGTDTWCGVSKDEWTDLYESDDWG